MTSIDRILFGDNQFFGVNHMSEEKARSQQMRFRDTESIIKVLDNAYDRGIRSFMCTTHDEIGKIADHVSSNPERYEGFKFLPGMPYAHKYNNMVGELGVIDTIKAVAPGGVMEAMVRGAKSAVGRDVGQLMRMLVDAEMARFANVDTPVVFLQNVVADLLLGLGNYEIFADFVQYVNEKYEAEAGFFSMNMPAMVDALETVEITNPIIACNYNKIGFRMSGGIETYDRKLEEKPVRCVAMSVLASGAIPPAEALEWVCQRPLIESIVFGASSDANISSTVNLINGFDAGKSLAV